MFLIQDSVIVAPERVIPATLPLLLLGVWQVAWPWITGKLTAKWNQLGGWLDGKEDMVKRLVYVAIAFIGLQVGKLVGVGLPDDPTVWGATAIGDLLTGIFGTLMAAIGIQSAKEKMGIKKAP
jgi:hypothetical protein